jgi:hypothetical protein
VALVFVQEADMAKSVTEPGDIHTHTLAESENYIAWSSDEPDGETVFHLELGAVTLHFFREEWEELIALIMAAGPTEG